MSFYDEDVIQFNNSKEDQVKYHSNSDFDSSLANNDNDEFLFWNQKKMKTQELLSKTQKTLQRNPSKRSRNLLSTDQNETESIKSNRLLNDLESEFDDVDDTFSKHTNEYLSEIKFNKSRKENYEKNKEEDEISSNISQNWIGRGMQVSRSKLSSNSHRNRAKQLRKILMDNFCEDDDLSSPFTESSPLKKSKHKNSSRRKNSPEKDRRTFLKFKRGLLHVEENEKNEDDNELFENDQQLEFDSSKQNLSVHDSKPDALDRINIETGEEIPEISRDLLQFSFSRDDDQSKNSTYHPYDYGLKNDNSPYENVEPDFEKSSHEKEPKILNKIFQVNFTGEEIQNRDEKIKKLELENQQLNEKVKLLEQTKNVNSQNNEKIKSQLNQKTEKIKKLENDLNDYEKIAKEKQKLDEHIISFKNELSKKEKKIETLQIELGKESKTKSESEQLLQKIESERNELSNEISSKVEEITQKDNRINEMEAFQQKLMKEEREQRENYEKTINDLREEKQELEKYKERIQDFGDQMESLANTKEEIGEINQMIVEVMMDVRSLNVLIKSQTGNDNDFNTSRMIPSQNEHILLSKNSPLDNLKDIRKEIQELRNLTTDIYAEQIGNECKVS
eukprot:gb/GECH01008993.1/.p1 GENE.gb/GECH01008993.1/~~gb/GECH01008993.1/.p1  ORF type:complete len:619 (+),score=202.51 gb/GECH01008993.1/:1-1857(+)